MFSCIYVIKFQNIIFIGQQRIYSANKSYLLSTKQVIGDPSIDYLFWPLDGFEFSFLNILKNKKTERRLGNLLKRQSRFHLRRPVASICSWNEMSLRALHHRKYLLFTTMFIFTFVYSVNRIWIFIIWQNVRRMNHNLQKCPWYAINVIINKINRGLLFGRSSTFSTGGTVALTWLDTVSWSSPLVEATRPVDAQVKNPLVYLLSPKPVSIQSGSFKSTKR